MLINLEAMKRIHDIQFEMMEELIEVMKLLNVKYYFVHGSLLGAVTCEDFIPEDDDIDIAIFREDYNRLMEYGNEHLQEKYFLQYSLNDDFPLSFAKMRNSSTSFVQPVLDNYKCNKGIYIDIFPIDYVPKSKVLAIAEKLLNFRINSRIPYSDRVSFKRVSLKILTFTFLPSYRLTTKIREYMYKKRPISSHVNLTNGKISEQNIPSKWFGEGVIKKFNKINVNCPSNYNDYLSAIYGSNYLNINPAEDRIFPNNMVKISASILDFEKSYKNYEK